MLTESELKLCNDLGNWIIEFSKLMPCHPSDVNEASFHIHALQNLVMSRSAVRCHQEVFTHPETYGTYSTPKVEKEPRIVSGESRDEVTKKIRSIFTE